MSTTQRLLKKPTSLFLSILSLALFFGCSDKSSSDKAVFKVLNESLVNSGKIIGAGTDEIMMSLQDKLADPRTAEKARTWFPRAQFIRMYSSEIIKCIDSLKFSLQNGTELKSNQRTDLSEKLKEYKQHILSLDTGIRKALDKMITVFTSDSAEKAQADLLVVLFDHSQVAAAEAQLSKLQNDIYSIENRLTEFCDDQCPVRRVCEFLSPFFGISSSYVKAGEIIEITTGVGGFRETLLSEIAIDNKVVPPNQTGATVYNFKASHKPGKHTFPVQIKYFDLDGKEQMATKIVEYTVAQ